MTDQEERIKLSNRGGLELFVRALPRPWASGSIECLVIGKRWDGARFQLENAEFVPLAETDMVDDAATLPLSFDAVQALMDDLWACGFRPSEKRNESGALAATEKHLADMQKIAFTLLDDKLEGAAQ